MANKVQKSDNITAKYMYRGCYINRPAFLNTGWFVHVTDMNVDIPPLKAKTLKSLAKLIDTHLDKNEITIHSAS